MSPRLLRILLPVLAFVAGAFALFQLFLAGVALKLRSWPFVAFYALMGIAGLAIASALWRSSKRIG